MGHRILYLRLSELFFVEGKKVLGYVAISRGAFPDRENVEVLCFDKIHEVHFDAVFLGDSNVEEGLASASEREDWLAAVCKDLRKRGVKHLGIRVHPSEVRFDYERYKLYFTHLADWVLSVEPYTLPIEIAAPIPGTPLYQLGSSAAIYGKENGFVVVSMKLRTDYAPRHCRKHLANAHQVLDNYVDFWL